MLPDEQSDLGAGENSWTDPDFMEGLVETFLEKIKIGGGEIFRENEGAKNFFEKKEAKFFLLQHFQLKVFMFQIHF